MGLLSSQLYLRTLFILSLSPLLRGLRGGSGLSFFLGSLGRFLPGSGWKLIFYFYFGPKPSEVMVSIGLVCAMHGAGGIPGSQVYTADSSVQPLLSAKIIASLLNQFL